MKAMSGHDFIRKLKSRSKEMKSVFRAALTVMCAAALVIPSYAQTTSGTQPTHNRLSRLQKTLNLSDTQVSQLQGLLQSQRAAMQPLRADLKAKRQSLQSALQGSDMSAVGSALRTCGFEVFANSFKELPNSQSQCADGHIDSSSSTDRLRLPHTR
jgi:hypothetical protein